MKINNKQLMKELLEEGRDPSTVWILRNSEGLSNDPKLIRKRDRRYMLRHFGLVKGYDTDHVSTMIVPGLNIIRYLDTHTNRSQGGQMSHWMLSQEEITERGRNGGRTSCRKGILNKNDGNTKVLWGKGIYTE